MNKLLKVLALIGLAGTVYAGPSSPPAGNYITNVSTIAAKPAFNVSSGTIRDQLKLSYISTGSVLGLNSAGVVVSTTVSGGGSATLQIPQTAVAVGTSSNTVTGNAAIMSANLTTGQLYIKNQTGTTSTATLTLDDPGFGPIHQTVIKIQDGGSDQYSLRYSNQNNPEARLYWYNETDGKEFFNLANASTMTVIVPLAFRGTIRVSSGMLDGNGSAGTAGQVWTSGGANTVPTWTTSGGGITLQEIQFSTTTRTTTTSATPANTAMTLSITLAGSGSCVEISASGSVTNDNSAGNSNWGIGLKRGNTLLGQSLYGFQTGQGKAAAGAYDPYSIHFIDKPLTAGATTYTVVFAADNGQAVLTPTVVGEPGILILKELSSCTKSGPF